VHSQTAAAEEYDFPHDTFCAHCRSTRLSVNEARWGTRLCDGCYDAVVKDCKHCGARLSKNELLWNRAMCKACYDDQEKQSVEELARRTNSAITADVGTLIGAQLIFYMAPSAMTPSLFLEIEAADFTKYWSNGDAASAYAAVLTTTTVVAMAAPIPFGIWAEARGAHEVYFGVTLVATLAALVLAWAPTFSPQWGPFGLPIFAGAWGCLSAPLSLRGVRAAYFSRHVVPTELSRIGQLASAAGLVGSIAGPLFAALCRNAFRPAALFAAAAHALAAGLLFTYLPLGGASRRAAEFRASPHASAHHGATTPLSPQVRAAGRPRGGPRVSGKTTLCRPRVSDASDRSRRRRSGTDTCCATRATTDGSSSRAGRFSPSAWWPRFWSSPSMQR